jgi:hypothetical protein
MNKESADYVVPLSATKGILLVNPAFPIPAKSRNHKDYLPIGLLKIARWLHSEKYKVDFKYGEVPRNEIKFKPDEIWITSIFTYWSEYVQRSAEYYRDMFRHARIVIGGIYATLKPDDCKERTGCDFISHGVHPIAEEYYPDYSLLNGNIDFQIVHTSRGCVRRCKFCYTHVIEPNFVGKCSILPEIIEVDGKKPMIESIESDDYAIKRKGLVFYDNNFLANEGIDELLKELVELKRKKKITWCESQSGFDGRILLERPDLAKLLKKANFRVPRIAWDWGYDRKESIGKQIQVLRKAKYNSKDIFVFMIYNWDISFLEMEQKRIQCFKWGVQISDCRYRPIDQPHDHYKPWIKGQNPTEYHIHEITGWDDYLVKQFRRNIREQNICVRHGHRLHVPKFERMQVPKDLVKEIVSIQGLREMEREIRRRNWMCWNPMRVRVPSGYYRKTAKPKC